MYEADTGVQKEIHTHVSPPTRKKSRKKHNNDIHHKSNNNHDDNKHHDVNAHHPYGRASWRDKDSAEVLEEVATNFPNFFASLAYFIWSNIRTILITFFTNWYLLFRHPLSTLIRLAFVPVVSIAIISFGFIFYFGRIFRLDVLLQKISSRAYGGRAIANWGHTDVLEDPDIEHGLELLTSGSNEKPSKFQGPVAKALLFLSSVLYEDEGSFNDVMTWHQEGWANIQLVNQPGRVYCKDQHDAVGNFAALFKIYNPLTKEKAIVLSFRGTSPLDLSQWLLDCSMYKVDAHDHLFGAVHEGFYRTLFRKRRTSPYSFYQRIVLDIEELAASDNPDDKPCRLWVTGHSLGAALASLFFARAVKTKEIKGIHLRDLYAFGSPHVANLDFRSNFTELDNSPENNTSRMYRVYNVNDPVVRVPFGFDDPNVLALSKGPSGLDAIDYCHFGIPVMLHQHTLNIPTQYPDFIVETPKDLGIYWLYELIVASRVGNIVDLSLSWLNVFHVFITYCNELSFPAFARLLVDFLETSSLLINHSPSTYCRNLSIKQDFYL